MTAFYQAAERAARARNAELVLIDCGASLDGLTRAALVACDAIVMPLEADFYSLQSLQTIGPTLSEWRHGWKARLEDVSMDLSSPFGEMRSIGYVVFSDRPGKKSQRWIERIPAAFHREILGQRNDAPLPDADPYHLATLKSYRSLLALARDARKPMFLLRPADGAIGGYSEAVLDCYRGFKALAVASPPAQGPCSAAFKTEQRLERPVAKVDTETPALRTLRTRLRSSLQHLELVDAALSLVEETAKRPRTRSNRFSKRWGDRQA